MCYNKSMKQSVYDKTIRCIFGRDTVRRIQKLNIARVSFKKGKIYESFLIRLMYSEYKFVRKYRA